MKSATRHLVRITRSGKNYEKQQIRFVTELQKLGTAALSGAKEFFRPNDKFLDATAKVIEAYSLMTSVFADWTEDATAMAVDATKAIASRRDASGHYTWEQLEDSEAPEAQAAE